MSPRKAGDQTELAGMPEGAGRYAGHPIEELRLGIIGASDLKIDQQLEPGDEIEVTVRGRLVRTEHSLRTRGRRQGGATYARERVVIRVDQALKVDSLGAPEPESEQASE